MKLPKHKVSLRLTHNHHKLHCQTVKEWLDDGYADGSQWRTINSKNKAIETDEIWTIQWYPDSTDGFHYIIAPTLDELLLFAEEIEGESYG